MAGRQGLDVARASDAGRSLVVAGLLCVVLQAAGYRLAEAMRGGEHARLNQPETSVLVRAF